MYYTYITTEAMTSACIQVFHVMYFEAAGHTDQHCTKSVYYRYFPVIIYNSVLDSEKNKASAAN